MINIELPDFETNQVLKEAAKLHCLEMSDDVTILMNPKWSRPFGMLYMAIFLRQWRNLFPDLQFYARIGSGKAVDYSSHMGFFQTISEKIHIGKAPGEAAGNNNYVPISKLSIQKLRDASIASGLYKLDGDLIELEACRLATVLAADKQAQYLLTYILRELMRNVPEHSGTDDLWVCGQHWINGDAEIAIIDEGIGIKESLYKNASHRPYIESDEDALRLAVKAGVSQAFRLGGKQRLDDTWSNSGFGLYAVSNFVKLLGGSFCLASGNSYLKMDESGKITTGDSWFSGTAVKITLNRITVQNSEKLINEVIMNGEKEASGLRNVFKTASRPSKGLILKDE